MTSILIKTLTVLRFLPLPWLRALGALMGLMVWALHRRRRHIVLINLQLCFPAWSQAQHRRHSRAVFVCFMQSWLDRFWLWHSSKRLIQQRLKWVVIGSEVPGDFSTSALADDGPVVIFAPHFMGLDAGWTALNRLTSRRYATIYAAQNNQALDAWVKAGRSLSMCDEPPLLINHHAGVRPIIQALRKNAALYLLPDMNYEPQDSLYTPFFNIPAATLPILPRYARLGAAKVVPVIARMTPSGYDIEIHPAWNHYPSGESKAEVAQDTLRMNAALERFIESMPSQYYWVHRRFKDQPLGAPSPY